MFACVHGRRKRPLDRNGPAHQQASKRRTVDSHNGYAPRGGGGDGVHQQRQSVMSRLSGGMLRGGRNDGGRGGNGHIARSREQRVADEDEDYEEDSEEDANGQVTLHS